MYTSRISRNNPTAFVILIDQSGSMEELTSYNGEQMPKSEAVTLIVNALLTEIINRSTREDGVRDYFDIAVYGYHGETVASLLPETKGDFMALGKLADNVRRNVELKKERRLPDGSSAVSVISQKIWIEAEACDRTPMYAALNKAFDTVRTWCATRAHSDCYPPTIFNITDGEASDGSEKELLEIARDIRSLSTNDGNVLLVNIHLGSGTEDRPVIFACDPGELPDSKYARMLYDMSSVLPENISGEITGKHSAECRAVGFNAAITDLVNIMNIGSVSVNVID